MRPPTIVFKSLKGYSFRIRYRQVSYVGRFFFVDIAYPDNHYLSKHRKWHKEFMKIKRFPNDIPLNYMFGFIALISQGRNLNKFMERVKAYDDYLDG